MPDQDSTPQTNPAAVGYVVGEVRTDQFTFVTNVTLAPPRLEYIVLRGVVERAGEEERRVDVLAQVTSLSVNHRLLGPSMNYNEVEAILRRLGSSPPVVVGKATVLGYRDGKSIRVPRGAASPGAVVEHAPDDFLSAFFNRDMAEGLKIGALINRPNVAVSLNPDGLNRHLAVIAQTGAGKSYTVGVILEQLLQLGGTVVVFDPNSDYVLMRSDEQRKPTKFAEHVDIYRVPSDQQSRISEEEIGGTRPFTLQFSKLEVDEVCDMAGIAETYTNIRTGVRAALNNLAGDYTANHLLDELERIADLGGGWDAGGGPDTGMSDFAGLPGFGQDGGAGDLGAPSTDEPTPNTDDPQAWFGDDAERARRRAEAEAEQAAAAPAGGPRLNAGGKPPSQDAISGAAKARKYIEYLAALPIWDFSEVDVDDLLRPMSLSTIDLAGADRKVADLVVTKVVKDIWQKATRHGLPRPVFLVLEEAHNLVPSGKDEGSAAYWIKRIAAEGRKFGVFIVLVTQRPYRIHQDTLSQCGSQIVMRLTNPEDQNAVRRASESVSESLLADLPGLNIGEAVILGPLVRVPVLVKVGRRQSAEGGSDINISESLASARSEAVTGRYVAEHDARREARGRSEWREEI